MDVALSSLREGANEVTIHMGSGVLICIADKNEVIPMAMTGKHGCLQNSCDAMKLTIIGSLGFFR